MLPVVTVMPPTGRGHESFPPPGLGPGAGLTPGIGAGIGIGIGAGAFALLPVAFGASVWEQKIRTAADSSARCRGRELGRNKSSTNNSVAARNNSRQPSRARGTTAVGKRQSTQAQGDHLNAPCTFFGPTQS